MLMPLLPEHRPRRPGLLQQMRAAVAQPSLIPRYVQAQRRHKAAGRPVRSAAGQHEAWAACSRCEFFVPRTQRCTAKGCGCFLASKIPMATEACPIGRWPAERSAEDIADAVLACLQCPLRRAWTCSVVQQPIGALVADRAARCPASPPRWTQQLA
jgi:hypothetical protein